MTDHRITQTSSPRPERGAGLVRQRHAVSFAAGAIAVVTTHQTVLWFLNARGLAPWPAWSTEPTRPLGIPAVASAAFWGGLWGIPLAWSLAGARSPRAFWGRAALFGALVPNLAGAMLVALGRVPTPRAEATTTATMSAVLVNACWGLTAAALLRRRRPG